LLICIGRLEGTKLPLDVARDSDQTDPASSVTLDRPPGPGVPLSSKLSVRRVRRPTDIVFLDGDGHGRILRADWPKRAARVVAAERSANDVGAPCWSTNGKMIVA